MKAFSSGLCLVAIATVFFAMDYASGYEYGESCCEYNGKRIADCKFDVLTNGLRVEWSDGLIESYELVSQSDEVSRTYVDKRGGVWEFLLHPQGNVSLTNKKNGNRIFKPLRGCVN